MYFSPLLGVRVLPETFRLFGDLRPSPLQDAVGHYYLQEALVAKTPPANAGDLRRRFQPWVERIPCGRAGNPLQYACLETPVDRGAGRTPVHGVAESDTTAVTQHTAHLRKGFPTWLRGKECACQCGRHGFSGWVGKIPWRRRWQPTPVFLPGKSHGQRSLVSFSP